MQCPFCHHRDSRVLDSRAGENEIRRRRACDGCNRRFTTYERVESTIRVVKKDGRREAFDRAKLLTGLRRACDKRPLPTDAIDRTADDIERSIRELGHAEIQSQALGEMVMDRLRDLDQIAYVRFASVYRQFTDIDSLRQAIDDLDRRSA